MSEQLIKGYDAYVDRERSKYDPAEIKARETQDCPECRGSGHITYIDTSGRVTRREKCGHCKGSGEERK